MSFHSLTAILIDGQMVGPCSSLTGVQVNRPITKEKAVSACTPSHASFKAPGTTRLATLSNHTSAKSLQVKVRNIRNFSYVLTTNDTSEICLQKSLQRQLLPVTGSVCQAGGHTDDTAIMFIMGKWASRGRRHDITARR